MSQSEPQKVTLSGFEQFILVGTFVMLFSILMVLANINDNLAAIRHSQTPTSAEQHTHITTDPSWNPVIDPTGCGCVPLPEAARP